MDREEYQAMMERQQMESESLRHDMERLLDELTKEQLITLRHMLVHAGTSAEYAQYWCGAIGGTLKYKHSMCGCGKDHDAELLAPPAEPVVVSSVPEEKQFLSPDEITTKMDEYNVRAPEKADYDKGLQHTAEEAPVICKGCGMLYQSLEDRMLQAPGIPGCPGCIQKTKWG